MTRVKNTDDATFMDAHQSTLQDKKDARQSRKQTDERLFTFILQAAPSLQ